MTNLTDGLKPWSKGADELTNLDKTDDHGHYETGGLSKKETKMIVYATSIEDEAKGDSKVKDAAQFTSELS